MKVIIIDLDDTLFCEQSYVMSGFRAVAESIAERNGVSADDVFNQTIYQFSRYGRTGAFNRTLSYFGFNKPEIGDLVRIYREHSPDIQLYWKAAEGLELLRKKFKLVIVTDGLASVQRKKIEALDLESMVDKVVYCMDYNAPKPSPTSYRALANDMNIDLQDAVIVGDDPYCDMQAAAQLQIPSYRILGGKYMRVKSLENAKPEVEFGSFCTAASYLSEKL